MTSHFGSGPGSGRPEGPAPSTNGEEPFDPVLAERFRLLDQVDPPPVSLARRVDPSTVGALGPLEGKRSSLLMATAAAAAVILLGLSALAVANRGSGGDVEAATATNDDAGDGLTSEAAPSGDDRATGNVAGDDRDALDLSDEAPATPAAADVVDDTDDVTTTQPPTTENGETTVESKSKNSVTTTETTAATTETTKGSETTNTSVATSKPWITLPPVTEPEGETTTSPPTSDGDPVASTVTLRGTVTEVFTDCQSRLILNDEGEIESIGPVSCDGGSWIKVDGTRVQTSSGYVPAEMAFNKHPTYLKPGQRVVVIAIPYSEGGGLLTLDCDVCRVRVGE